MKNLKGLAMKLLKKMMVDDNRSPKPGQLFVVSADNIHISGTDSSKDIYLPQEKIIMFTELTTYEEVLEKIGYDYNTMEEYLRDFEATEPFWVCLSDAVVFYVSVEQAEKYFSPAKNAGGGGSRGGGGGGGG